VKIVVDTNLLVATVFPLAYSDHAKDHLLAWRKNRVTLFAPTLTEYEITNVVRRRVADRLLTTAEAIETLQSLFTIRVRYFTPTLDLHQRALVWAERIRQPKAYDAQYLALADYLQSEMWTADKRLVGGGRQAGIDWIHWVGEPNPMA